MDIGSGDAENPFECVYQCNQTENENLTTIQNQKLYAQWQN